VLICSEPITIQRVFERIKPAGAKPGPIALCAIRGYIPATHRVFERQETSSGFKPQIRETMRAEVERLVEEIKQSVGLLRRHL
jgi:hypothetical protein